MSAFLKFVLIAFLVLFAVAWFRFSKSRGPQKLSAANLQAEMIVRAQAAVDTAGQTHGTKLDFTHESIMKVEQILSAISDKHATENFEQKSLIKESLKWGGYIGETIRKRQGGKWELSRQHEGTGGMAIRYKDQNGKDGISFPVGWCYKRIVHGGEENVWQKYSHFVVDSVVRQ